MSTRITRRHAFLLVLAASLAYVAAAPPDASPNDVVLRVARSYADGGGYNTKWAGSGTPEEVRYNGDRVLAKGTGGTYCCGFTFAVAMQAGGQMKLFDGKSLEQIKRFQKQWYGAVDDPEIREKQCALAAGNLGVGRQVSADEARPGDFMQLWRTPKGGHSVIFLSWIEKDGKRVGFRYRSSQGSTKGIGDHEEYFSDSGVEGGKVLRDRVYFGRFVAPDGR